MKKKFFKKVFYEISKVEISHKSQIFKRHCFSQNTDKPYLPAFKKTFRTFSFNLSKVGHQIPCQVPMYLKVLRKLNNPHGSQVYYISVLVSLDRDTQEKAVKFLLKLMCAKEIDR